VLVSRDVIFEENVQWRWGEGDVGLTDFQVEEEVAVSIDLGVPSGTEVLPTETGAEAMENSNVGAGGDPTDSTQEGSGVHAGYNSDEDPERFRNLNDIYENIEEVVLMYDSDGEALLAKTNEPTNYVEASGNPDWVEAMDKEILSIEKNGTWYVQATSRTQGNSSQVGV